MYIVNKHPQTLSIQLGDRYWPVLWGPKSEERDVLFSTGQKQGHDGPGRQQKKG